MIPWGVISEGFSLCSINALSWMPPGVGHVVRRLPSQGSSKKNIVCSAPQPLPCFWNTIGNLLGLIEADS